MSKCNTRVTSCKGRGNYRKRKGNSRVKAQNSRIVPVNTEIPEDLNFEDFPSHSPRISPVQLLYDDIQFFTNEPGLNNNKTRNKLKQSRFIAKRQIK